MIAKVFQRGVFQPKQFQVGSLLEVATLEGGLTFVSDMSRTTGTILQGFVGLNSGIGPLFVTVLSQLYGQLGLTGRLNHMQKAELAGAVMLSAVMEGRDPWTEVECLLEDLEFTVRCP